MKFNAILGYRKILKSLAWVHEYGCEKRVDGREK